MDETLKLLICERYRTEVELVFKQDEYDDVEIIYFPSNCLHPHLKSTFFKMAAYNSDDAKMNVCLCNCLSFNDPKIHNLFPENYSKIQHCTNMFLSQNILQKYIDEGAFIITPGWLLNWEKELFAYGNNMNYAREFFRKLKHLPECCLFAPGAKKSEMTKDIGNK
jgi:two-component system, OmpR family, phosphate regulon sensor histidine kinase PhoR